jgi:hypothetical protein
VRFIQSFGTATGVAIVDTDLGEGYLKALGNPEGPHALACELVGSMLAEWLGLSTLDFSLVELTDDDEIPFLRGGSASPGPAFVSRAEPKGIPWDGTVGGLRGITNSHEISGLVVLDTWLLNCDRHAPDGRRVNRDNVFLIQSPGGTRDVQLRAIDFTHTFTCGGEINRRLGFIEKFRDERVYGLFPEFTGFLDREEVRRFANLLSQFPLRVAEDIIAAVPQAWGVDHQARSAWATMITERAHFISENIEAMLWPQMQLEGGTE